ncbi:hypothetical protein GCM10009000_065060 [Halobacterium noricense]|uniref:Uncharacterized protein n=1 Tax=Haladaptatus pallidirubidus TaxID=1008152 RepID=A0AAV3UHW6_9EURY
MDQRYYPDRYAIDIQKFSYALLESGSVKRGYRLVSFAIDPRVGYHMGYKNPTLYIMV